MTSTNKTDAPQSAAQPVEREDKYRGLALAGLMFTLIVAVGAADCLLDIIA
ncbi:hypothetical protein ACRQFZ_09530 [Actinotignum sp. GS-2025b]|uniref:hypothetical protein n=1 Tax=Actinotignum sp. GS-2025b TaxID=3427275 RepID=UPI003F486D9E